MRLGCFGFETKLEAFEFRTESFISLKMDNKWKVLALNNGYSYYKNQLNNTIYIVIMCLVTSQGCPI